jgi:type II secretory pathway component GspD/PulD (secretin)/tetratricopeptide (TPR) repeat protein
MKTIPQNFGNVEQKETKIAKVSWRAELCDAVQVHRSSVTGSQELAPPSVRILVSFVAFCFTLICVSILCATSFAQTPDNVAEREVQRRQAAMPQGEAALKRGNSAMKAKNYTLAHEEYKNAVGYLPDSVVSGKAHDEAVDGYCKSGVVLAQARIAQGDYAGAEAILNDILSNRYSPSCREAQELYKHLRTPGYFNKTVTANFINKVEEVKQLLTDADGFYQSGQYDLAMKRYDQVLALDPYNTAARKGQEKIDNTKYEYGEEAYNETRARHLWKVEKAWEQPVRKYGTVGPVAGAPGRGELRGTAQMTNKLNSIIIPHLEFRDATIREAIDVLREQAAENDAGPEGQRGVNIVLRLVPLGQVAPPSMPVEPVAPPEGTASPAGGAPPGAGAAPAAAGAPPGTRGRPGAPPVAPVSGPAGARITVTLDNIPLGEALRYIASQAGLKVKVEPYAVSIIPLTEQSNDLITKRYHVPPEFFGGPLDVGYYLGSSVTGGAGTGVNTTTGTREAPPVSENVIEKEAVSFQTASGTGTGAGASSQANLLQGSASTRQTLLNDHQLVGRADAITMLKSMGVSFPAGASATFWPHSGTLIVRNTQDNLDMVDALVDQANSSAPKQVAIESKFVEINQNNLKELGFDWLLGPFSLNGKVFGSGGTAGNGAPVNAANFPFVDPVTGKPIGQNPVTSGNQSGNFAISANALDALLMPGLGQVAGAAPGIFGLAGVFTNPQFQVVVRALNQKKGIDLLSAPSVTTKSGQRAIIEVIRELRYPRTYTAPQVPSIGTTTTSGSQVVPVVVTPTTPQDWETRNTGVTLEVEPVVGGDATTIDLNLVPQVVEFEGFINYGSPINAVGVNTVAGISVSTPVVLTENVINQPVFSTRKVTTSVSVYDGQTVVLGGLMREDVQKTEDKVPIIGDIPLVGRAFRTNTEQHTKKNLVIFVTARIITPAGLPLNEEEEEGLLPPALPEVPAYKK